MKGEWANSLHCHRLVTSGADPHKIGKNMIFWRKIVIFQAGDSVNCMPIPPSFLLDLVFNLNMHDIFAAGCQATIDQQILLSSDDDHSLINVYVVVNFCDCVEANLSRLFV
jgi:hypothetical protein